MQTCAGTTRAKSAPCGECDQYAYERPICGISRKNATAFSALVDPMQPLPAAVPVRRPLTAGSERRSGGGRTGVFQIRDSWKVLLSGMLAFIGVLWII